VKNGFVLAPLVFSRHLLDASYGLRAVAAALAFCALSGAVYAFNDVRDIDADRAHPRKRFRPVAAGTLSQPAALSWAAVLAVGALLGMLLLDWRAAATAALYLAVNLAYSLRLKEVAFLDVSLIGAGFLLRVLAGAYAISVPASAWLLACTGLLAVMLGLGKRAHELSWSQRAGRPSGETRAALAGYRLPMVRVAMLVLAAATCLVYVLYTRDPSTIRFFKTDQLIWTSPFPVVGITRFLTLTLWRPSDDSPTEAMLRDPLFLLNLAAWGGVVVFILYG
jgi:4-hydroxybenzoate polyprenyltransferase